MSGGVFRKDASWYVRCGAWTALIALAIFRLGVVFRCAVDIPLLDEWDMLGFLENNVRHIQWKSFFDFHNDHRIFFTRLVIYLEFLSTGWDIRHTLMANYAVFLAMVASLIFLCRPLLKGFPPYPLFFVPFFSDYVWINMGWSFQSQFHFMILFALCAIWFGLARPPTARNTAGFIFFCGLSMFSMSPTCALGVWCVYALKQFSQMTRENWTRRATTLAAAMGGIAALTLAFFSGYRGIHLAGEPGFYLLYPWNGRFWSYSCRSLANAFAGTGYDCAPWLGFFVAPAAGLLVLYILAKSKLRNESVFPPLAIVAASLVSLAAIAYGRGYMERMACDRHMEVLLMAIPALMAVWATLPKERIGRGGLLAALLILLKGYSWYLVPREAPIMQDYLLAGKGEIVAYAKGYKSQVDSELLYPTNLTAHVLRAEELGLSFTREIPTANWSNRRSEAGRTNVALKMNSEAPDAPPPPF